MLTDIFLPLATSLLIGGLIGLEREKNKQQTKGLSAVGIRTDLLISLFGAVSTFLGQKYNPIFFLLCLGAILIFTVSSYIYLMVGHKRIGITTEVSTILVFLLSSMSMAGYPQLAVILAIITTLILSLKKYLHHAAASINQQELFDTIKFAIISFIILPFLPNKDFDLPFFNLVFPGQKPPAMFEQINVLNPYKIWFLVVMVSGVSFIGYVLVKLFGKKKGISFAGLLGGLYSSTATSLTLAHKSKELPKTHTPFIAGIVLACGISFLRTFIEIRALNAELFWRTFIPICAMFVYMMAVGLFLIFSKKKQEITDHINNFETPFKLKQALKLAAFLIGTLLMGKMLLAYSNLNAYYIIAGAMAFFAVDDPVIITTSATAGSLISYEHAKNIIVLITCLNMVQKVAMVYFFGNRQLFKPLAVIFGGLVLVAGAALIFF